MTSDDGDAGDRSARTLLAALATINRQMIEVWSAVRENPAVARAARSCDTARFADPFRDEWDACSFDAYVEATTRAGVSFSWGVRIWMTSSGWELYRSITKEGRYGEDTLREFADIAFKSIDDLARDLPALIDEFVGSARTFDFEQPHTSASDNEQT